MAPGSKRSFGSALFDWPAADGYESADEHAPETWLALLAEQLFGGTAPDCGWLRESFRCCFPQQKDLSGLLRSCKGGRDMVWGSAGLLVVNLRFGSMYTGHQRVARISDLPGVKRCLAQRGERPTQLLITGGVTDACAEALLILPGVLYGTGQSVTELHVTNVHWQPPSPSYKTWLGCCAMAFPNLTTLNIDAACAGLPGPARLPKLRHLSLHWCHYAEPSETEGLFRHTAAYLPQLDSVKLRCDGLESHDDWGGLFALLFNDASTSHTLTKCEVDAPLSGPLVSLLAAHCPALKYLKVSNEESITSEDINTQLQWSVTCVDTYDNRVGELDCDLDELMLPLHKEAGTRTHVERYKVMTIPVDTQQGFSPEVYQRVCGLSFEAERVRVVLSDSVEPHHHTQALEAVLGQLKELRVVEATDRTADGTYVYSEADAVVELIGWQWDTDMLQTLSASLPELSHLKLGVRLHTPLTDALLGVVLQMAPHLRSLSAPSLALQSDTHANTPWPWDELTIDTLDIADLCKLPDPSGAVDRMIYTSEILFDAQRIQQVGLEPLLRRLRCWSFNARTEHTWTVIHSDAILSMLEALFTALDVQRDDGRREPENLKARDWPLTKQGLADLTTVMQYFEKESYVCWGDGSLDLSSGCTWPIRDVDVYTQWAKEHGAKFAKGWKVASSAPYNVVQALSAGLQAVEGHKKPKLTIVDM